MIKEMVVIVCTWFEGTGLLFVVCSIVFKMWQELRSVCRCPCPRLTSHQSFVDKFIPIQQAVKRPGVHNRVRKFFIPFHWWRNRWRKFLVTGLEKWVSFCFVLLKEGKCLPVPAWKLAWTRKDITIPKQRSGLWLYPFPEVLF